MTETIKRKKGGGFESMNLVYPVYKAIKARGFNVPTPIQRKAIPLILEGRDIVACSRTGSGKTAAFVIPLVNKLQTHSRTVGARALIVLPTRELALQITSVLKSFIKFTDLTYSLLVGGHNLEGQFESLAGNPDILIVTPGRLSQLIDETGLTLNKVEFLIFDECDYLFEMGFADQMKTILKKVSQNRQTLMFSATIPEELSSFARAGLKEYVFVKLDSEYTLNENLSLNFLLARNNEKFAILIYLLEKIINYSENTENSTIIFASTKYHVDLVSAVLEKFKIENVSIYGKMDPLARKDQINEFKSKRVNVLVVTDLAARGIDLPHVQNVIHFDLPAQTKIFIHRSGRTGRAGKTGNIYAMVSMNEIMYINEVCYYVGRKISEKEDDFSKKDNNKAYYGVVPSSLIEDTQGKIEILQKEDIEIYKMQQMANNAFIQFLKTRESASKVSVKNQKMINREKINPLFANLVKDEEEKIAFLNQIRHFKPQQCALEIFQQRQIKNAGVLKESDESYAFSGFQQAVQQLKKQEKQFQERKQRQEKISQLRIEIQKQKEEEEEEKEDILSALDEQDVRKMEKEEQEGLNIDENDENIQEDEPDIKLEDEKKPLNIKKKIKKSQILDFRHKDQYINAQQDHFRVKKIEDSSKIQTSDVNAYIVGEDYEDILRNKKKNIWDKKKKQFVRGKQDEVGRIVKDKEDKHHKKQGQVAKEVLKKWQKKNMVKLQKEGETEDSNLVNRVKGMFKKRNLNQKGIYLNDNNNEFKQKGVKNELKNQYQLLKNKKIKKGNKLKNMDRGKRSLIIQRNKQNFKSPNINKTPFISQKSYQKGGRGGRGGRGGIRGKSGRGGFGAKF
ncbi:hypothetical protein IMG5_066580 [Ichthyophthirius multifiliis]|uniref:RNA helicase n=1 Tax=Ichthyophthirius multifiliis TaxID=5932 RepID=G0QPC9_ICHMU|nr:hypothetical protein IMG5_066580 [Ichthyophthirius multifiliis]EGR32929.1 hypothetical protein IMG5_066580 [Ichthyophthirius multifiliis]|eukprot:XP_004036915.1 hypothetical protein IMG5_066580 [Ichthyophthirius multifiliis]